MSRAAPATRPSIQHQEGNTGNVLTPPALPRRHHRHGRHRARPRRGARTAWRPRVEIAGVVDLDRDRAREFAERFGVDRVYPDAAELFASERLDLVHICTPPQTHTPLAIQAMRAGVPSLVEKPTALSLGEMDELAAVQAETGVPVLTVFQHRFGAAARHLKALAEAGELGRPLVATCETLWYRPDEYFDVPWRGRWDVEGGGPTMGHGIHQFDLLFAIFGRWSRVSAFAARQLRPTDTEDVSMALVRFENDALATVVNSLVSPHETSRLRFDFEYASVEVQHLYGYTSEDWTFTPAPGHEHLGEPLERGTRQRSEERSPRPAAGDLRRARGRGGAGRRSRGGPAHPRVRGGDVRVGVPRHHDRRRRAGGRRPVRPLHERRGRAVGAREGGPRMSALRVTHELGSSVTVRDGDVDLFTYVYQPSTAALESPKPYLHPLRTRRGDLVSLFRPHDHVWHKGIAWSLPVVERRELLGRTDVRPRAVLRAAAQQRRAAARGRDRPGGRRPRAHLARAALDHRGGRACSSPSSGS